MKPLCDVCGDRHEKHQAHRFASNNASNKVTASNGSASNNASNAGGRREADEARERQIPTASVQALVPEERDSGEGDGEVGEGRVKQRWSREKYNAYQREYMKKRRTK